jgi:hypothetical protein
LHDTNCYANGAKAHNDAYICNNGKWESIKKTTGNKVLELHLDEGSGINASDSSGYNNHGTLTSNLKNRWTKGYSGTGLNFSNKPDDYGVYSNADHITIPYSESLNIKYNIKLDAWAKFLDDVCCYKNCAYGEMCSQGGNVLISNRILEVFGRKEYGYRLYWGPGWEYASGSRKFCFDINTDVYPNQQVCSKTSYVPKQWHHIATTAFSSAGGYLSAKLLVDGALVNEYVFGPSWPYSMPAWKYGECLTVGCVFQGYDEDTPPYTRIFGGFCRMEISELFIPYGGTWNTAEIVADYNDTKKYYN